MKTNHVLMCMLLGIVMLGGCQPDRPEPDDESPGEPAVRVSVHDHDDLVSAGLGLEGLAGPVEPVPESEAPDAARLRRMAIHAAWQGIYSLTPAGGVGGLLDSLPRVPGREFHAFLRLEDAEQPFRVMLQLPDGFDRDRPCLVAAPASGSRGVYGALPLAAPWALPAGCAVVYTDKGAGTDFFDFDADTGVGLDGRRARRGTRPLGFEPEPVGDQRHVVAMPHAHSGDHPEADWGRHVLESIDFALDVLAREFGQDFRSDRVRVIAAGLSNGGGAVLRAAEQDQAGRIDAVVAVMPNITVAGQTHLFDYALKAALYQPCVLADLDATMDLPLGNPTLAAAGQLRCGALVRAGLLQSPNPDAAREVLAAAGFDRAAMSQAAVNLALDLWRSVVISYASAYLGTDAAAMPCGYRISAPEATSAQRHAWWATHSGIAPGGGIEIVDTLADGQDRHLPGLLCLRRLMEASDEALDDGLHAAIGKTLASGRLPDIPVLIIHGRDDGLVPVAFSSRPYVELARERGARIAYWEVDHAQHFDALLGAPGVAGRFVPLLPYGWAGLERIGEVLDGEADLGEDRRIRPRLAPEGEALRRQDLGSF